MRTVSSFIRPISPACLVATIALLVAAPAGSAATSLKKCSLTVARSQQLGATYVTKLKVRGVSCATGERVVKAFQSCRRAKGLRGRCRRKILRYRCTDARPPDETIPTQLTGHVTCKRGTRRVNHVYQQNT